MVRHSTDVDVVSQRGAGSQTMGWWAQGVTYSWVLSDGGKLTWDRRSREHEHFLLLCQLWLVVVLISNSILHFDGTSNLYHHNTQKRGAKIKRSSWVNRSLWSNGQSCVSAIRREPVCPGLSHKSSVVSSLHEVNTAAYRRLRSIYFNAQIILMNSTCFLMQLIACRLFHRKLLSTQHFALMLSLVDWNLFFSDWRGCVLCCKDWLYCTRKLFPNRRIAGAKHHYILGQNQALIWLWNTFSILWYLCRRERILSLWD